jgi:hypothetical protein
MKNISLNLSISLTEYGISGFTLKDTTSISTSSIYPEVSQISANYLRTKDIVFIDLITLNTIDNPKVSDFYYVCHSDQEYTDYKLNYSTKIDGWHIIDHLALPNYEWVHGVSPSSLNMEGEIFYSAKELSNGEVEIYEITIISESYTEKKVSIMDLYSNQSNSNIIGIEEETFLLGNLEYCYENKLKYIYYNKLYTRCNIKNDNNISQVFRDRNMVFIALELIHRLIDKCSYYEAERIIEEIQVCGGFCSNDYIKYSTGSSSCNCRK